MELKELQNLDNLPNIANDKIIIVRKEQKYSILITEGLIMVVPLLLWTSFASVQIRKGSNCTGTSANASIAANIIIWMALLFMMINLVISLFYYSESLQWIELSYHRLKNRLKWMQRILIVISYCIQVYGIGQDSRGCYLIKEIYLTNIIAIPFLFGLNIFLRMYYKIKEKEHGFENLAH